MNGLDRSLVRPSLALTHTRSKNDRLMKELPSDVEVFELGKRGFLDQRRVVGKLRAHLDEHQPDVMLAKATWANVLALSAARGTRRRPATIVEEHAMTTLLRQPRNLWLLWFSRRLYPQASAVVTVSRGMRGAVAQTFGVQADRVRVLYPAYDAEIDSSPAPATALGPPFGSDLPVVVYVGRLSPKKGVDDLIRAVEIVSRTIPVRLLLVGDGPQRGALERLTGDLGLTDVVTFAGFDPHPHRFMAAADVYVVPSHTEAFGTVTVEGLRSGAAVVATDCDFGPRELIENDRNGLLVEPQNPAALAEAMVRVITQPELSARLRAEASLSAERFSPARMVNDYERLILELADARSEMR